MEVDDREVRQLVSDLGKVEAVVVPKIRAIVQKTMVDTKRDLQAEASGVKHAPALPSTITYDTRELRSGIEAEIGPRTGGTGSLALLYYGNSRTGPRLKDPMFAMARNAAKAEPFFAKAAADVL